ncbi:putative reverse transcriptase domain-containing protein [Tanacetum coccineum]
MYASDLATERLFGTAPLDPLLLGQMSEIRELHATDRRRKAVTSKMLKSDQRRSAEMRELRIANHTRQQQLIQTINVMQEWRCSHTLGTEARRRLEGGVLENALTKTLEVQTLYISKALEGVFEINSMVQKEGDYFYAYAKLLWENHINHDVAYAMTLGQSEKENKLNKYCPRNEMQKLEAESCNLKCERESDKIERSAGNANNANNQRGTGSCLPSNLLLSVEFKYFQREWLQRTNPDSNVVTGTFLLNNRYASILFDTGADRSFVSTAFIPNG